MLRPILCLLLLPTLLPAAEFLVATHGDDHADGSRAAPWRTVQRAVDAAAPGDSVLVLPGTYSETVVMTKGGTAEQPLTVRSAERHRARVEGFVLKANHLVVAGFAIDGDSKQNKGLGIYAGMTGNAKHEAQTGCAILDNDLANLSGTAITCGRQAVVRGNRMRRVHRGLFVNGGSLIEGNEIDTLTAPLVDKPAEGNLPARKGPKKTSYAFFAGDDITFRGNHWHGTYDGKDGAPSLDLFYTWGIDFFTTWDVGGVGPSNRILIEGNRCFYTTHAVEPLARQFKQSTGITLRNNLFVNACYVGIFPQQWTGVVVEHNTLINCGAYPVWSQSERQSQGMVVRNNLIATWRPENLHASSFWRQDPESGVRFGGRGTADSEKAWAALATCGFNLFHGYRSRGYGTDNVEAEPQFIDPDHGDFRLKPGSPGIDAGTPIEGLATDLAGAPRVQGRAPDLGCFEHAP